MSFRNLPPLAQLRAFAALAETGGMSSAGELLNVSHAAISQQVRALEERLGVKLMEREGRSIVLTPDGRRLGKTLRDAFESVTREIEDMTGADADRPLQITCTPSFAARWLMPRMGSFREAHPDINLMINPTADRVDPAPGGLDLAIRFGLGDWKGLDSEVFLKTRFVIAAARSLIGDREITSPRDLLEYPWLQEIGTNEAKEWLTSRGVTEARVRRMTDLPGNLLQDALRAGEGVAATARAFIEPEIAAGDIVVLFQDDGRGMGYHLVTRPGPKRPVLKSFLRWLRRQEPARPE
ncbi:LysR family transcriptional regulator [Pseudoruegeria sp. HB172150]|uniref:LysR family transcriptional regulator n=1 Tax=Pseudoruegeria sp. HB172150 TaxID=2721164 RepID=UPI0015530B4F|nr:LysR family transcriptional regulator [Pseudoruegeria sp. HB172150]